MALLDFAGGPGYLQKRMMTETAAVSIIDESKRSSSRVWLTVEVCLRALWKVATRKLDQLDSVQSLEELRIRPGNRKGEHSIRINEQFRTCFIWTDGNPVPVEIVYYH